VLNTITRKKSGERIHVTLRVENGKMSNQNAPHCRHLRADRRRQRLFAARAHSARERPGPCPTQLHAGARPAVARLRRAEGGGASPAASGPRPPRLPTEPAGRRCQAGRRLGDGGRPRGGRVRPPRPECHGRSHQFTQGMLASFFFVAHQSQSNQIVVIHLSIVIHNQVIVTFFPFFIVKSFSKKKLFFG